jgi:hypothetical protein
MKFALVDSNPPFEFANKFKKLNVVNGIVAGFK